MSISHRKINELIEDVINTNDDFNLKGDNKEKLIELCKKIYLIESTMSDFSAQRLRDELSTEILHYSNHIKQEQ
jgi:hypothetical protein